MTERRWDDDSGQALARALADDRYGSKAQRGGSTIFEGLAQVVLAVGRSVRSLIRWTRR